MQALERYLDKSFDMNKCSLASESSPLAAVTRWLHDNIAFVAGNRDGHAGVSDGFVELRNAVCARATRGCRRLQTQLRNHFLAHDKLLRLASHGHRHLLDKTDVARDFIMRDLTVAVVFDLLFTQG